MDQFISRVDNNDRLQMKQIAWTKNNNVIQRYDYLFGQINPNNNTVDTTKNNGQLAQVESYIGGTVSNPTKQFTQKFSYDSIGRLEKETETRGDNSTNQVYQQVFKYDRFGNRYLKAADNPTNQNPLFPTPIEDNNIDRTTNRLASNANTLYDDAGNITTDGKYRNLKYFYDANGRMFKTSQTNDTNQHNAVFDAIGNKVATKVNDVWRFLVYDAGGTLVAEYGGTDSTDEGGVKFVHQDLQGSTRLLTNLTGTVLARIDYQAFGEEIPNNIGQRTAQGYGTSDSIRQRYGLTDRDEATGLDDTWFRKLEQRGGRWTSPDPYNGSMSLDNPQSFNRYSYVENQPTNFIDPSGLFIEGPGAGCSRGYLERVYYGNDNNGWILVSERFTCYDSNSGSFGVFNFGGGSGRRETVEAAVKRCGKELGLDISNFKRSTKGKNGSAVVTGESSNRVNTGTTITNDVNTFNKNEIGQFATGQSDTIGATFNVGDVEGTVQTGPTKGRKVNESVGPHKNYTANNLTNSRAILATQIHELGNSIFKIFGKSLPLSTARRNKVHGGDKDAGAAFEDCVFGGRITENGTLQQ